MILAKWVTLVQEAIQDLEQRLQDERNHCNDYCCGQEECTGVDCRIGDCIDDCRNRIETLKALL